MSAPTFDAAVAATQQTSTSTYSWTHTVSGANTALFVCLGIEWTGVSPSSVTYNGVAMTQQWEGAVGGGGGYFGAGYTLKAPATGANLVQVTMSGAADRMIGSSASFNNVDQTTPFGTITNTTGTATNPTITAVSDSSHLVVAGLVVNYNDQMVSQAPQTERARSGPAGEIAAIATLAGSASTAFLWDRGAGSSNWILGYVILNGVTPPPGAATAWLRAA